MRLSIRRLISLAIVWRGLCTVTVKTSMRTWLISFVALWNRRERLKCPRMPTSYVADLCSSDVSVECIKEVSRRWVKLVYTKHGHGWRVTFQIVLLVHLSSLVDLLLCFTSFSFVILWRVASSCVVHTGRLCFFFHLFVSFSCSFSHARPSLHSPPATRRISCVSSEQLQIIIFGALFLPWLVLV